jgi:hypothetical protein
MKKHIITIIAFAVSAASALAYQATELDVKVPFAFKVGAATLPAGTYAVTEANAGFVLIRGTQGGIFVPKSAIVLDVDDSGKISLKFNRSGNGYVLGAASATK